MVQTAINNSNGMRHGCQHAVLLSHLVVKLYPSAGRRIQLEVISHYHGR